MTRPGIDPWYLRPFTKTVMPAHVCVCVKYIFSGLVGRVFANGQGDLGSIPDRVIPKILKMVFDTSLLNTQQYKIRFKGKVEQSREMSSPLSYTSV